MKDTDGTLKRIFPHLARNSQISYLLDNRVAPKTVAKQSGHLCLEVLMRYHHPDEKKARQQCVDVLTGKLPETSIEDTQKPEIPKKPVALDPMISKPQPDIEQMQKKIDELQHLVKLLLNNHSTNTDMSIQ